MEKIRVTGVKWSVSSSRTLLLKVVMKPNSLSDPANSRVIVGMSGGIVNKSGAAERDARPSSNGTVESPNPKTNSEIEETE